MLHSPVPPELVGRATELDRLARLAGVVEPAQSGIVVLTGDAGIGKTSLLRALLSRAEAQGWRATVGHCVNLGGSPLPYLPFTEVVGALRAARPDLWERLAADYPALGRLAGRRHRPTEVAGEAVDRAVLFDAVHAALSELGATGPLLLVIEDLHWADQSTYDLLTFLFARRFETPVSIVASYRSDDLHRWHPLRPISAEWARLPGVSRLDLQPLSDAAITELVQRLQQAPITSDELRTVLDRAEGNAFFAEELLAATRVGSALPRDLAGLLLIRVDQLDPAARQLVRAASAAGGRARHDVLAEVSGLAPEDFDRAASSAVDQHVLVVEADGYAFRHALLAEAVYGDLLPGERTRLHAAYVHALTEARFDGAAAELARHAVAAGDHRTALRASLLAGDDAAAAGGPDEALTHYELALDVLTRAGADIGAGTDPVMVVEKAATAAIAAGRTSRAITVVQQQLEQSAAAAPTDRARLLIVLTHAALLTDSLLDSVAATAEALALVPVDPLTALRVQAVAAHALALADRRRDEEAIRWAHEGLELAGTLGLDDVAAQLKTLLARISERGGDAGTSRQLLEQVIEETHARDDPAELRALYQLGSLEFGGGHVGQALELYRRGAERAREVGRPYAPYGVDARVLAGLAAYQLGEWDEALALVDTSGERTPPIAEALLDSVRMCVCAGRGDVDGLARLDQTRQWWAVDGMIAVVGAGAAIDLYGDAGRLEEAVAVHDDVVGSLSVQWQEEDFQARIRFSALLLGQLGSASGHAEGARRHDFVRRGAELALAAERAMELGRDRHHDGPESQCWLARARAEWLRLRWLAGVRPPERDELVAAWRLATDEFQSYGHPFEWARSVARWAGVTNDDTAAGRAERVAEALAVAERLRAGPLLSELRAVSGGHRRSADLLTPRESEVLLLVAEGRSNREIGELLFISTKTASVHVSNILAKLGVTSRTEAVAVARRRGLLG